MSTDEPAHDRPLPPRQADERATIAGWLFSASSGRSLGMKAPDRTRRRWTGTPSSPTRHWSTRPGGSAGTSSTPRSVRP
ncbi:hypothetical protein ACFPM0_09985 [Pseudonocardia sulfidoxydans]|uniref:hypothetical protein n=1 Tax=Pseudonocardia sulfidoxydans TaxID=54011 RepID=UPI00361799A0